MPIWLAMYLLVPRKTSSKSDVFLKSRMIIDITSSCPLHRIHLECLSGGGLKTFEAWHTLFCFRWSDLESVGRVSDASCYLVEQKKKIIGDVGNDATMAILLDSAVLVMQANWQLATRWSQVNAPKE